MTKFTVFKAFSHFIGGIEFEIYADKRSSQAGGYFKTDLKREWMPAYEIAELYRFFRAAHEELRK